MSDGELVSREAYLAREDASEEKSEFHDGRVFARVGGSYMHSLICANIGAALVNALRGSDCRASNSDIKIFLAEANSYVYPDNAVICGPPEFEWPRTDIVRNPTLVVEVLSPETASYDRGGKFRKYRTLKSLREYVLVEQDAANVDVFYLNEDGQWVLSSYAGLSQEVELRSLGVKVAMADLYRGVEL